MGRERDKEDREPLLEGPKSQKRSGRIRRGSDKVSVSLMLGYVSKVFEKINVDGSGFASS